MNYFFGFENKLANSIDWFFNANHLFLIAFVALVVVSCLFIFHFTSEKGKRASKIIVACVLFVLEVGRTIYKYLMHVNNGGNAGNFNWWWNISFQMCAIMTWTTIFTLILSACVKKENHFLQFMYNILFGCAMVGGILTFCYPDCLNKDYPFFHFINIQTVLVHALLIFVPLYLIKIKEFKVEIKNVWKPLVGYNFVGCFAMSASIISGNNFAFSLKFDLVDLGLPFPWYLPVVLCVVYAISATLYGCFELARFIKRKITKKGEVTQTSFGLEPQKKQFSIDKIAYIVGTTCAILFGTLIMLCTASLIGSPIAPGGKTTMLGLLCLLGFVYMLAFLFVSKFSKKYLQTNILQNKNKTITLIVLTFIFALPLGVVYLVAYNKAKTSEV